MALNKFRVSYNVFGELSCNSFFACSDGARPAAEPCAGGYLVPQGVLLYPQGRRLLGALCGAGIGISLVNGGSTAGTDIVAMIINKYRNISPGKIIMYIDVFIIGCSYFIGEDTAIDPTAKIATIIYGYVVMGVNSYTIDLVFTGQMQSVQFLIFSQKYEDVANSITRDLRRGVTVVDCQGWYTGEARKMLIVVARKSEMQNIMRVTKMADPDAFLTMNTVMGVYGRGFDTLKI